MNLLEGSHTQATDDRLRVEFALSLSELSLTLRNPPPPASAPASAPVSARASARATAAGAPPPAAA
eukprot:5964493-Prymnesium_polylepis.1